MIKITGTKNNNLEIKVILHGEVFDGKLDLDHRVVSFHLYEDYECDYLLEIAMKIAEQINFAYNCYDKESAEWYEFNFFYYDEDLDEWNTYGCSGFKASGF